jgi:hypothetical protein
MVAHHRQGRTRVDHRADDLEGFPDLGPAVDEVAEEDSLAFWVPVDALVLGIAEFAEELISSDMKAPASSGTPAERRFGDTT